jgi:hypothetical protein
LKSEKRVRLTPHAEEKLGRLAEVQVTEEKVIETVLNPECVASGYFGRKIAQSALTSELVLRVIYEEMDNKFLVITVYPAKRGRYV